MQHIQDPPEVKLQCWVCEGEDIWVRTKRMAGESEEDWCARHDAAVLFWMTVCPKD